ncbi:hypothetical protein ABW21_db0200460 [Orbilia brochopaga]|nr:hypothetical protein ABW21_db0200460 [Drechslerella brochopaga]
MAMLDREPIPVVSARFEVDEWNAECPDLTREHRRDPWTQISLFASVNLLRSSSCEGGQTLAWRQPSRTTTLDFEFAICRSYCLFLGQKDAEDGAVPFSSLLPCPSRTALQQEGKPAI